MHRQLGCGGRVGGRRPEVSLGVASHQLSVALELRDLPRAAQVFAAGAISYRVVAAVIARTRLIRDRDARSKVHSALAARIGGWGPLSVAKTETEIDYWVDRYDPAAVRRSENHARGRHVDVHVATDGSGTAGTARRGEPAAPVLRRGGEEVPLPGHTLELVRAALLEFNS